MRNLPLYKTMEPIATLAGLDVAEALVAEFGGATIYVPARYHDRHELPVRLGAERAARLQAHFAGSSLQITTRLYRETEQLRASVLALYGRRRVVDICAELRVSARRVYEIVAEAKKGGQRVKDFCGLWHCAR